jgi:hypothetical protein
MPTIHTHELIQVIDFFLRERGPLLRLSPGLTPTTAHPLDSPK